MLPRLPEPMLLRSARLPTSGDYAYEPKWDGFRALVSRNGHLRVKSRRGWDMTSLVPELAGLPDGLAVDGELVAFGDDSLPSFPRLCDRMLHGKRRIEVMLIVFDVLAIDGREVTRRPYWERRKLLEDLATATTGRPRQATQNGEALWEKICQIGLKGVVAKKRSGHYLPGRRGWIKTKNRAYWRYPLEDEAARLAAAHPRRGDHNLVTQRAT
jgi:bifunctional non-homologous end joining protein LigD